MSANCQSSHEFSGASQAYRRALIWVILINAFMFIVEMSAGIGAQSQALKADALDFLGDSVTYGLSLWAVGQSPSTRSNVAMIKGVSLVFVALWVLFSTVYYVFMSSAPHAPIMGSVAVAALLANVISVLLLLKYRDGDANVRSVWLCSRNDAIGNVAVLGAAVAVYFLHASWPDLLVASILAILFLSSAVEIIKQSRKEQRSA